MRFEKVSFEQYVKDIEAQGHKIHDMEKARENWEAIRLPERATRGSAGYDFFLPCAFRRNKFHSIVICTGIRAIIDDGYALFIFPKSGLGFKHGMRLANTVGVIDSDYSKSDNEGHIMVKFDFERSGAKMAAGDKFVQGIFLPYATVENDTASGERNGGFGSTGA